VSEASYYDRQPAEYLDGTPIFKSAADEQNENTVSAILSRAWRCEIRSFGRLSVIDWYAIRDGRIVAVLELKTRTHDSGRHATVFLNVRKWLALLLAATGLGVPAIFVVQFTDGTWWIPLAEIEASTTRMGGCVRIVKSRNDIEPVIHVPVAEMRAVAA
jgi:hypothetical protein